MLTNDWFFYVEIWDTDKYLRFFFIVVFEILTNNIVKKFYLWNSKYEFKSLKSEMLTNM